MSYDFFYKFILIGDSGVGKSSLLLQFTDKRFKLDPCFTIGVDYGCEDVTIEGSLIRLQIWDTAGQEKFRSIVRLYYKEVAAAILVYDCTRRETFYNVARWLEDARQNNNPNLTVILIANKSDFVDRIAVSKEEGEKFANENGLLFMETSAKTGENVEEAFTMTATKIFENIQKGVYDLSSESSGIRVCKGIRNGMSQSPAERQVGSKSSGIKIGYGMGKDLEVGNVGEGSESGRCCSHY